MGDYLHQTFDGHLLDELGMKRLLGDPSVYYLRNNEKLIGITAIYVYHTISCDIEKIFELTSKKKENFDSKTHTREIFTFSGVEICREKDNIQV